MPEKFTLQEILSDKPEVIIHDLKNAVEKKPTYKQRKRGGNNESPATLKAILEAHELTLTKLNRIENLLESMRK